jgi:hypothetical protein
MEWTNCIPEEPSVKKYFFINRDLVQTQLRAKGHLGRLRLQQQHHPFPKGLALFLLARRPM